MKVNTQARRLKRKKRVRKKIRGTGQKPRLTVFRSNQAIYSQLIDDDKGRTLAAVSSQQFSAADKKLNKTDQAQKVGQLLAEVALKKKITQAVFDRGSYQYHGRVKALAEGVKKGGLQL